MLLMVSGSFMKEGSAWRMSRRLEVSSCPGLLSETHKPYPTYTMNHTSP